MEDEAVVEPTVSDPRFVAVVAVVVVDVDDTMEVCHCFQ